MATSAASVAVTWTDGSVTHTSRYSRRDPGASSTSAPIVVLLHGADGNIHHFADPGLSPGQNNDLNWRPPLTASFGWWAVPPPPIILAGDPHMAVEGIEPFLVRNGYRTVNYSQIDPNGLLRRPVLEFDAIFRDIRRTFPQAPIHIICHSRGGLLIRRWLATSRRANSPSLTAIKSVQTLSSPHRGSALADLQRAGEVLGGALAYGPDGFAAFMARYSSSSVMMELAVTGNAFLTRLESDERALAAAGPLHQGVAFHAFAGTAPRLFRLHWYQPLADSYVPQWNWPPFRWRAMSALSHFDVPDLVAASLPLEARPGLGDVLVSVASTVPRTWTPAQTWSFPVNHASVLWDQRVKDRILTNLGGKQPAVLARGTVRVTLPTLRVGQTQTATVTVANSGPSSWGSSVSVRTVAPFPAAPWSARVRDLHVGGAKTLTHPVLAPARAGTYQFGWALQHDQSGEFGRSTRTVTVEHTCETLAEELAAKESELASLKNSKPTRAYDNDLDQAMRARAMRILALIGQIAELRALQRRMGC